MRREPKKTDFLELRVPTETKTAFMDACRANGTSASSVLRSFIHRYLHSASRAPMDWKELGMLFIGKSTGRRAAAGALAVALTSTIAVVSLAGPAQAAVDPRLAAVFEWIDSNHDGGVTATEFRHSMSSPQTTGAVELIVETRTRPTGETRDALFTRLDSNADETLSLDELSAQGDRADQDKRGHQGCGQQCRRSVHGGRACRLSDGATRRRRDRGAVRRGGASGSRHRPGA